MRLYVLQCIALMVGLYCSARVSSNPCIISGSREVGECIPLVSCPSLGILGRLNNACHLMRSYGNSGVCCWNVVDTTDDGEQSPIGNRPIFSFGLETAAPSVTVSVKDMDEASAEAVKTVSDTEKLEQALLDRGLFTEPGSAEDFHNHIVAAVQEAIDLGKEASIAIERTKGLLSRLGSTSLEGAVSENATAATNISLPGIPIAGASSICPRIAECLRKKYYSVDGSCNNLKNRHWGKSVRAFQRLLPPQYADGTNAPRVASDGSPLPSVRLVSTTVLSNKEVRLLDVSMLFMSFGQFLDHDLTLTPQTSGAGGVGIVCCNPTVISDNLVHPACLPISVPVNDPFYARFNVTCMEFVRSLPAPLPDCTLGPREQMNQVTAYLDASQVYGSTQAVADNLRSMSNGKLRVSTGKPGREFPINQDSPGCTTDLSNLRICFIAGDVRAREQPQLATLQVLFLREHNRLADELLKLNPGWNDETVYQEVRKIVIAKLQHITYNEFLPIVLGEDVVQKFGLKLVRNDYWDKYDENTDATILNEFATAAYRFGHSSIPTLLKLYNGWKNVANQRLRDFFATPYLGNLTDYYVGGLTHQNSMSTDNQVTQEVTEHLFERGNTGFGLDLPSLNMQRGRDHAIGTYTRAREICGLPTVSAGFDELKPLMYPGVPEKLESLYKNVSDVDLWIAGVSEKPLPGAAVGPVFACIIAEQFRRTRKGDRLWYERGASKETAFNKRQLAEIRKTSMARILCDNSDVDKVQPLAFLKSTNSWNRIVKCDQTVNIQKPTTLPWKVEVSVRVAK